MSRRRAVLAMQHGLPERLFDTAARRRLSDLVDLDFAQCVTSFDEPPGNEVVQAAEVLLTGWGCPRVDQRVLVHAPRLAAVVHAGGSVKGHLDRVCWDRGLVVSTAADVNAIPVAEFTVGMVLLTGKATHTVSRIYQRRRAKVDLLREFPRLGNRRRRVGVVGASRIGRRVLALLRPFQLQLAVHDPLLDGQTRAELTALGVVALELDDLLRWADVVSLHAPALPQTRHMIDARRLALMPDGATLINTARGALVDHAALVAELVAGRLSAALDVTEPDVPPADSPLYHLPNVMLTPHLAGALGNELFRLGEWATDEVQRFVQGQPFAAPVRAEDLDRMA